MLNFESHDNVVTTDTCIPCIHATQMRKVPISNVLTQYVLQLKNGYMVVYRFAWWVISHAFFVLYMYLQKMNVFKNNY